MHDKTKSFGKMKLTEENLRKLYIEKDLTQKQIAERCDGNVAISYHLRKHGIYKNKRKSEITKEDLETLYWEKDKSAPEIAKMFGYKSSTSIYDRLRDWNIGTKNKENWQQSRVKTFYKNKLKKTGHSVENLSEMSKNPYLSKTDISEKLSVKSSTVANMIEFFGLNYMTKSDLINTKQIVHLHKNLGWQCPKIAEYYGVSSPCIYKRMKKNGYEVDRPFDFFTRDELYWLYHEKNKSAREIADLHGACQRQILLKLKDFDIEIKNQSDYDYEDVDSGPDHHSEEAKRKMRKSYIEELKEKHGEVVAPNYNPDACDIIDEYGEKHGYNFQHAENGGEHHIKELGYWVDGYDEEQNAVIEVDESHHFKNEELRDKDKKRQREIEDHLRCEFIRVKI